ncbi:hypothetical protein EDD27_5473 [Nonomuraea polychroma]|uniref:Uncharacterized protein n=1 Tax=Nonomuraea polychroma TaxID=46176 RepID=A0A438MAT6_9ACTN|nr:hypothetical protein EDD27_5473 [Nonomuraea polychroma]
MGTSVARGAPASTGSRLPSSSRPQTCAGVTRSHCRCWSDLRSTTPSSAMIRTWRRPARTSSVATSVTGGPLASAKPGTGAPTWTLPTCAVPTARPITWRSNSSSPRSGSAVASTRPSPSSSCARPRGIGSPNWARVAAPATSRFRRRRCTGQPTCARRCSPGTATLTGTSRSVAVSHGESPSAPSVARSRSAWRCWCAHSGTPLPSACGVPRASRGWTAGRSTVRRSPTACSGPSTPP